MLKFSIGSDPEAFIINNNSGLVVSAKRFTYGTKSEPEDMLDGYALLNDNILIEGNVPPATNKYEFSRNMFVLWNMMEGRAKERDAHLHNTDHMTISEALLATPEAQEFGCSSFRDAWNELVEIQTPQLNGNNRPAGCHIHLGFDMDQKSTEFLMAVVRAFDMFLTIPAIERTGMNYRTDNLYGILGACRLTSYGVECRSLGGTFFNPKYFEWIYENVEKAVNFADEFQDKLIKLPNIYTYIGSERIKTVKEYSTMFNQIKETIYVRDLRLVS
jgi:hypothetical protein